MSIQQSRKSAGDWSALRTQVRELEDRLALLENVFDRIDEIDKTVNELKTTMRDCRGGYRNSGRGGGPT